MPLALIPISEFSAPISRPYIKGMRDKSKYIKFINHGTIALLIYLFYKLN